MDKLKIALCQHNIVWEDARATISQIDGPVRRFCARTHPDLLAFPEAFSVGFTMNPAVSEPADGPSATWLRELARSSGVAVVASVPTLEGKARYNRCYFIAPDGQEWHYDKHHLFTPSGESPAYDPGNRRCTVPYRGWNIALNVCYDLRFPVWSRNVGCEYDLLLNIANWPDIRIRAAVMLLHARAIENACYAAFCNRIGQDTFCDYDGRSMIVDFFGDDIARRHNVGGVPFFSAILSLSKLQHYRERFPVTADADDFELIIPNMHR